MPYVISRAAQDMLYTGWKKGRNNLNTIEKQVLIKGGANVLNKKTMETVKGVITEVSAEDLNFLRQLSSFKRAVERGWLVIETKESTAKKVAEKSNTDEGGNEIKDGSAQLTPKDFKDAGQKPPVTDPNKIGEDDDDDDDE